MLSQSNLLIHGQVLLLYLLLNPNLTFLVFLKSFFIIIIWNLQYNALFICTLHGSKVISLSKHIILPYYCTSVQCHYNLFIKLEFVDIKYWWKLILWLLSFHVLNYFANFKLAIFYQVYAVSMLVLFEHTLISRVFLSDKAFTKFFYLLVRPMIEFECCFYHLLLLIKHIHIIMMLL